jgi:hypothetical protein
VGCNELKEKQTQKYHTVGTVLKSDRKIVPRGKIDTAYSTLRDNFTNSISSIVPNYLKLNNDQKLIYLMI